ncbi:hypothetical protein GWN26_14565 [Candidatus Saccharibacteria bacterium]|nr:DUF3098 domain-containing protein [Candidatus Saccharibacteria bacterium]NIV04016.1 hypothetical protein [Calditrichia bacterium]NIV73000.1 hypothetical protein [Calditrichia bacterium]NIW00269.1 hypothetical protein [Candidatus Saccharibacteria bacterium]NIW80610.1 hypothetical protein [Calditrichia bacterium]
MAKVAKTKKQKKADTQVFHFPLQKSNYMIILAGILILIVGYILMALPDHPDAFISRTLAPVLLVFSFLIVIPYGLLRKDKHSKKEA